MAEFDVEREIARVSERVERTAERAERQFARVGRVTGRAESADGAVGVEVHPGGLLAEVRLTSTALRSGSDAVARQIMELAEKATRRAGDRMFHTLAPVLGPGSERRLRELGYEPLPEDDDVSGIPGFGER
ncbi:hypothetical protein SAMN05421810_101813 [Amycolatopsis arida]|uniref:YbaB/EbfC DNA-binding family protein n=1 Tax=Amycolatopsis arida TaxID=587909 RepID=A0A1I5M6M0_9PSEU|nr:hypothetical protein [Amycolatopsis arida]TDX93988.1 hypothetical protein CLV69_104445 [Amycolatopsis arida]SFP05150.1 hypothetical protein SAMN05421810_101813 [Amycolatopsis arida]